MPAPTVGAGFKPAVSSPPKPTSSRRKPGSRGDLARDAECTSPSLREGDAKGAKQQRGMPGQGSDHSTRNTFIASSPRWLIIFTAIRPVLGA